MCFQWDVNLRGVADGELGVKFEPEEAVVVTG
jgi:hypothetical protein